MAKDRQSKDKPHKTKTQDGPVRLEDDAALWARVAETAMPLTNRNRTSHVETPQMPAHPVKAKMPAKSRVQAVPASPQAVKSVAEALAQQGPRPSTGLDRQPARKLGKGHLAVQARLDLHGMRQREAHTALRRFLHWARNKDYRHVLVITGKGSGGGASSYDDEDTRGVLRQSVPHWLGHGDLAPLIVSFSEAPRRLGGEGALYVRLRKAR